MIKRFKAWMDSGYKPCSRREYVAWRVIMIAVPSTWLAFAVFKATHG